MGAGCACPLRDSRRACSMKALVSGCHTRNSSTAKTVSTIAVRIVTVIHLKKRLLLCGIYTPHGDDDRIFERRILILLARTGTHARNLVHDIEPLGDAAEHGVTELSLAVI